MLVAENDRFTAHLRNNCVGRCMPWQTNELVVLVGEWLIVLSGECPDGPSLNLAEPAAEQPAGGEQEAGHRENCPPDSGEATGSFFPRSLDSVSLLKKYVYV